MYRYFIRPILFTFQPETVHYIIVKLIKISFFIPGISHLVSLFCNYNDASLKTEFLGLSFKNPVGLAAGFDKNAEIYNEFKNFGFGFIEIGTITPKAQPGNPKPRSFRLTQDKALINRMGFNNHGVDKVVKRLKKKNSNLIVGGNIGKNTETPNDKALDDYVAAFQKVYEHVDYVVINLSCPNIKNLNELQDKHHTMRILNQLTELRKQRSRRKPILLKISPDLTTEQLDDAIEIFYSTEIDGIIATNTTITREDMSTSEEKIEKIGDGGMSGAPLKDKSTKIIRYINKKSNGEIPVIGVGGIMSAADALEKLEAGAKLVQVYTGFIYNGPGFVKKINKELHGRITE